MNDILLTVGTVVGSLGGIKFIDYLMNLKHNNRKNYNESIKSTNEVLDDYVEGWKSLSDQLNTELERKRGKIDSLYQAIDDIRKQNNTLQTENISLRLSLKELEFSRCTVNGCQKRQPPRDFSSINNSPN